MSQNPYFITGRRGDVFPRLEIRDLQQNTEQFTLFIHSLAAIMLPEHRPRAASFVELGGIHGLPYERWSGDPAEPDDLPTGTWGGYCHHESVLFPTWHRPYTLAIEQSIGERADRLAKLWTRDSDQAEKDRWLAAAKELRFPFWDWTSPSTQVEGFPDVLQPQTFIFDLPGGKKSDPIDNPLAFYDFGSRVPDGFANFHWSTSLVPAAAMSYFETWKRTYRWPSSKLNPIEDYVKVKSVFAGGSSPDHGDVWSQVRDKVAKLFTFPATISNEGESATIWDEFSNTTFQSKDNSGFPPYNTGSLESPHNLLHLIIGGLGHMAHNDYAAFDPIFHLHHCNVDRILSFWEYVYSDYWMGDGYKTDKGVPAYFTQDGGTYDQEDDGIIAQGTPLQPFRKDDNTYWSSTEMRFLQRDLPAKKYYTYPPIGEVTVDAPLPTDADQRRRYIKILYDHFKDLGAERSPDLKIKHPLYTTPIPKARLPSDHVQIANEHHFTVEVELVGHAFTGSYLCQILCAKEVIGSFAVLSRGDDTACAACQVRHRAGGLVRGVIDIPGKVVPSLISDGPLDNADATTADLIGLLKKKFSVRIVGPSGVVLAEAVHRDVTNEKDDAPPRLDKKIAPKLRLLSAAVAHELIQGQTHGPVRFLNWEAHDKIFDETLEWTVVSAA